ncbi:integrase [Actinotalea ferrariae CF5-4]|uniref:Integrase n=1 Tax=Actinotalea ferrariae CF5-4 TaxID=948458 RepID=A0A021VLQ7_9CELL|nr:tyrosine-type recombinase/integrase [Actinotalea ferrariae]EYR62159.1 integrase [Actinotalea ferrariae CF5-4]
MTTAPQTWDRAIAAYCLSLHAAGRRPRTVELYRHYLRNAATRLGSPSPWTVTGSHLEQLLAGLDRTSRATRRGDPQQGAAARKSMRTALAGFYRWARRHGYIDVDPCVDLPGVRVPAGRPRPAPESVVRATLAAADDRVRLMVLLAVLAGLRAGEVACVHRDDILDGGWLLVHGKGGKQRTVPLLDDDLADAIASATGWVFPNGRGSHLTANHVSKLIARAMPEGWTAHTLRHRFGTRVYAGSRDLLATARLLGHASPQTTLTYVQMPEDHLREAVAAAALIGVAASRGIA